MVKRKNKNIDWYNISKYLFSETSVKEKEQFMEWQKADPKHEEYIKQSKYFYSQAYKGKLERPDVDKALSKFKQHIAKKNKKRLKINLFFRYAAAVFIVMVILTHGLYEVLNEDALMAEMGIEISESPKAKLILADGQEILLEQTDTTIQEVDGIAITNTPGRLKYNEQLIASSTVKYNTLQIPRGGEYHLELADGTKVWFNSESTFRYPTQFTGKQRDVYLSGEAYFEVKHDKSKPFIVKMDKLNVKVLGTEFNIKAYGNESQILTTLVNGSVEVSTESANDGNTMKLSPGHQAIYSRDSEKVSINQVKTDNYTAWKDGYIVLDNTSLEDLCTILSRRCNVDFVFQNEALKNTTFTGKIKKYENIEDIFILLEQLSDVSFTINNSIVTVR